MIEAETRKQIGELVELNEELLAQNKELKAEHEALTRQLESAERVTKLRAENIALRKQLEAEEITPLPTTTAAYDQLASLAKERAAQTHVTVEKAFTQIITEQPDLYRRHREELRSSR